MKKILLNATFVALALGTHGYAAQPQHQSISEASLHAIDEKAPQSAPTPSRLKPALMVAGLTGASLAALTLLASPSPLSDVFGDSDQIESSQRLYNIQVTRQLFVGALATGLVTGGATYADVKGKVGALVKKIKSLFTSKTSELSQDEKEHNANQPQGSGFLLDSFLDSYMPSTPPVAPHAFTGSARQGKQAEIQKAVKPADKILDEMLNQKAREILRNKKLQKEASLNIQRMVHPSLLDQKLIEAQHDAIVAQYPDAYAIVPVSAQVETAPTFATPVSSVTSTTVSSQPTGQPAPVAVATAGIEDAKKQEPVEQKIESPAVLQQNIANLTPAQRNALSSTIMPLTLFMRAAFAPQQKQYTKPALQLYFNDKMAELSEKYKAAQPEAQTALVEEMRNVVQHCNQEEESYLKQQAKKTSKKKKRKINKSS